MVVQDMDRTVRVGEDRNRLANTRSDPEDNYLQAASCCSSAESYLSFFWLLIGMPTREWAAAFLSSAPLTYWPWL